MCMARVSARVRVCVPLVHQMVHSRGGAQLFEAWSFPLNIIFSIVPPLPSVSHHFGYSRLLSVSTLSFSFCILEVFVGFFLFRFGLFFGCMSVSPSPSSSFPSFPPRVFVCLTPVFSPRDIDLREKEGVGIVSGVVCCVTVRVCVACDVCVVWEMRDESSRVRVPW